MTGVVQHHDNAFSESKLYKRLGCQIDVHLSNVQHIQVLNLAENGPDRHVMGNNYGVSCGLCNSLNGTSGASLQVVKRFSIRHDD